MEEKVLNAEKRSVIGKQVKALRRQGGLPAILYGHHFGPLPITLNAHDAAKILTGVTSSQLLTVNVDGQLYPALVREKQRHPVRGELVHVDFLAVSMTEKLRAMVVIDTVGEAPAVTEYDGLIVTGVEELEVECLPGNLMQRIVIDLSPLTEIGSAIYVRDIKLSSDVTILTDPDEMVVLVTAPAAEEVEEVEAEVEGGEPEVIEKGKREEDFE